MCLRHEGLEKRHQHYPTPTVSGFQGRDRPTDLPTNVQAVSRAVSYVNTHRPRIQVWARPSYLKGPHGIHPPPVLGILDFNEFVLHVLPRMIDISTQAVVAAKTDADDGHRWPVVRRWTGGACTYIYIYIYIYIATYVFIYT